MKYMVLIAGSEDDRAAIPEADRMQAYAQIRTWWNEESAAGRIVEGYELQPTETATTVREERSRLVAALVRVLRDWDIAEELVQEATVAALETWPRDGIPENPGAWLLTTARRRGIDRLRRDTRYRERLALIGAELR